jgi:hypothetical protein
MLRARRDALFARTEPVRALEAHLVSLVENKFVKSFIGGRFQ